MVSVDYSSNGGSSFTTYYCLRNAQNDVVKLIDGTGATVVQYTYDSWGKHIATTDTLASTVGQNQPFRYRGYVYDAETGWYYLQSRYYDPTTCRFISADVLLSTGQGVLGHNAYTYCLNNPINMYDTRGYSAIACPNVNVLMTDAGGSAFGSAGGASGNIGLIDWLIIIFTSIFTAKSTNVSEDINWNNCDREHIINGSKPHGGHNWSKFTQDPNGSQIWKILLPLFKQVVDKPDRIEEYTVGNGTVYKYFKYFVEYGQGICVKIWESADGAIRRLSDAWPVG